MNNNNNNNSASNIKKGGKVVKAEKGEKKDKIGYRWSKSEWSIYYKNQHHFDPRLHGHIVRFF